VPRARLVLIGVITFAFNVGGGLIAPAVPLYARSLGGDYRDLGLIGASHGLAFALLTLPLGRASDHFGRRALLLLSALAVGGAAAVYAASTHILGLAAAKLLEAAGWAAFWPALEAWVAEEFEERSGTVMGIAYGAYAASFVVGTSAAGFVIEAFGLRTPFLLYLATSAVALALSLAVPTGRAPAAPHASGSMAAIPSSPPAAIDARRARGQRLLAYGTGFVYVYGLGTILAFLPAYAADRGLSPRRVGLLLGAYWIARVAGSLVAGRVSDALGRRVILVPAMIIAGVGALLVAVPDWTLLLFIGAIGLGLTAGASAPTCIGLIADHVASADRGLAMGFFEASCGVGILAAGLIGGTAAQTLGAGTPYLVVAAVALGWCAVLARRLSSRRPGMG
jgi:MFS family permease